VASKAEVGEALARLLARLDGNEAHLRSAIPGHKVLRCHVPDLDSSWYAVINDGHVSRPTERPPDDGRVDVTLQVASDDLVDLVEERVSFPSAFLSGKVRVDASLADLLRMRNLL
jgi:hypothetical protein